LSYVEKDACPKAFGVSLDGDYVFYFSQDFVPVDKRLFFLDRIIIVYQEYERIRVAGPEGFSGLAVLGEWNTGALY
jgi:hypothetical protein